MEIAKHLALYTLDTAAEMLEMPVSTLRYQAARIYIKLGAKSKREVAEILYRADIL